MTDRVCIWLNDARGIYIPRDFAQSFKDRDATVKGVSAEDWVILEAGPDHEHYWDTWTEVENKAKVYLDGPDSKRFWRIQNDGDCFLVRDDVEWCDECDGWKDADCGCPHTGEEE